MPKPSQPAAPEPAEGTPLPVMPPSVRVATITMGFLAALLLVNAGLLWYGYDGAVDGVIERSDDLSRAEAERIVTFSLVPNLVLGLLLGLAAWFVPRRQPWARWIGLAASLVLGVVSLFAMLAAGGISAYSLLVLVLSAAAATSLIARTTGTWVPSLRTRG